MKIMLLTICFLHLVITKHYLVKTGDEGQTNKHKEVKQDHIEGLDYGISFCQVKSLPSCTWLNEPYLFLEKYVCCCICNLLVSNSI